MILSPFTPVISKFCREHYFHSAIVRSLASLQKLPQTFCLCHESPVSLRFLDQWTSFVSVLHHVKSLPWGNWFIQQIITNFPLHSKHHSSSEQNRKNPYSYGSKQKICTQIHKMHSILVAHGCYGEKSTKGRSRKGDCHFVILDSLVEFTITVTFQ